ncbi:MAG: FHA domain-containing protein [Planctomycetes bacterium]|nr:FHA domain-containing protein [Planctomycetota bacterium]
MALVTLRVLDGSDRGRVFESLAPPVSIGREEGNTIQLNDERVSRFHLKIQDDHDRLVLTDLESTNGTKVNGEVVQLRILRVGDTISVGRSVLLFGSREEIAERLARLRAGESDAAGTMDPETFERLQSKSALDFELNWGDDANMQATLHALRPPELPERLSPGQAAQMAELLEYIHIRLRNLVSTAQLTEDKDQVILNFRRWQNLVDVQSRIAEYLRRIGSPE